MRQKSEKQKFKEAKQRCFRILSDYFHLLRKWEEDYAPLAQGEELHPRFIEAMQKKGQVEYLLDLFLHASTEEQRQWMMEHTEEITNLERRIKEMAEKPTNRERLREITEGIEQGIKELFESDKYMRYLSVMSRFHRYSVNNTMLIYMQKPDATLVAGYNKWKNQFERYVKRGEHGITIIAPTPYKKKIEEQKLDPDTQAPMLDAEGRVIMEEKEVEIPLFRPVKVFDVSQTDGKPLPELASSLSGNVQNYEVFMEALRRSAPVPIEFESMGADMDGYFSSDQQRIALRPGMSEVQTVSAAVHEIAHSKLHNPKQVETAPTWKVVRVSDGGIRQDYFQGFATEAEAEQFASDMEWQCMDENEFVWLLEVEEDHTAEVEAAKDRRTEEVQAESISYAVCQYYGIQTGENSFGYIASWSQDKELKELRASLEVINKTSCELITAIDKHYKEICKERGIDPAVRTEPEQKPDPGERQAADTEQFSYDRARKTQDAPIRYYVAECMEFPALGEYHDNLSLEDAVRLYQSIPAQRMNGIKGIGFELRDGSDYEGTFPILTGNSINLQTIREIDCFRDNPHVKKAVQDLVEAMPEMQVIPAREPENSGLGAESCEAPLVPDNAAYQQMQKQTGQQAEETTAVPVQMPDTPEQALDKYPMPDPALTQDDLEKCGYLDNDLLPLSKERAYELMEHDLTVYIIQQGENPEMALDSADLDSHDGIFAVARNEWEESPEFEAQIEDRINHQQERELAFLDYKGDCYAIYQLKHSDELRDIRYEGLDWIRSIGRTVQRENYELVYTAPLVSDDLEGDVLENLYYRFNNEHPADYRHPSLSVSDIIALKRDGKVSCHYIDSFGFSEIPGFLSDNPLKNAEMAVEDDYGMIDGILNNGQRHPPHREQPEKRKSVVEQLKSQPKTEYKRTAPQKSAEREI